MTSVLLETLRESDEDNRTIWIHSPEIILSAGTPGEVETVLCEVEKYVSRGFFAAGFLAYESGYAFLPAIIEAPELQYPMAWFAVTRTPQYLIPGQLPDGFGGVDAAGISDLCLSLSPDEYASHIDSIRRYIEKGETYQVNFTMRYNGLLTGSSRGLYRQLRAKQRVPYAAFIESDEWTILSLSPELLIRKQNSEIMVRPMKGTSSRGRTLEEDAQLSQILLQSEKERAENLMIVDLLRNDLGKICQPGTIEVAKPLEVEKYETVLQMTSTIEGKALPDLSLYQMMHAVFPSGSVTGAPKLRTAQIIQELEKSPRGIYTGAIGYVSSTKSVFNVAIRTVVVDQRTDRLEMGVGSGILYEADALREYEECRLKGRFLTDPPLDFQLVEAILWLPESGFQRLDFHLERLINSAGYFVIPLRRERVTEALPQLALKAENPQRVRILVDRDGFVDIVSTELESMDSNLVGWSGTATDSFDRFLYHKTTARKMYTQELDGARRKGLFDVLFCNERGEVTEGAISNIFILKNRIYYTPPVSCGLLAGTYRRYLMEQNESAVVERVLFPEDVAKADAVYVCNTLRGLVQVQLVE